VIKCNIYNISGPDFQQLTAASKKPTTDRKKPINFQLLESTKGIIANKKQADAMSSAFLQNGFYFENLDDPFIEENLNSIKKDPIKIKKFRELVDFYTQNK
jgi:hypothetical protein